MMTNLSIRDMPGEVWMPIPNCPGYSASCMGRIRSDKRQIKLARCGTEVIREIPGKY